MKRKHSSFWRTLQGDAEKYENLTALFHAEKHRLIFVGATFCLSMVGAIVGYFWNLGPWGAATIAFLTTFLILGYIFLTRDKFFAQLFLFGLVAGFAELPSDYYSVSVIKALTYPPDLPFIWTSPFYMPFGYVIILFQFGYLGYLVFKLKGLTAAIVATGLVSGLNVPLYEFLAKGSGFWEYHDCSLLFGTVPYYIIVGEIVLGLALPAIVIQFNRSKWPMIPFFGILMGVVMFIGWWMGYQITG